MDGASPTYGWGSPRAAGQALVFASFIMRTAPTREPTAPISRISPGVAFFSTVTDLRSNEGAPAGIRAGEAHHLVPAIARSRAGGRPSGNLPMCGGSGCSRREAE